MALWLKLVTIIVVLLHWGSHGSLDWGADWCLEGSLLVLVLNWLFCSLSFSGQVCFCIVCVKHFKNLIGGAFVSCLEEHVDVDSELDGITSWSRPEVVLPSFESVSPGVKLHR